MTLETVGLDFGTPPFWGLKDPPFWPEKTVHSPSRLNLSGRVSSWPRHGHVLEALPSNQDATLADAVEASDGMQIITRLDAQDELDGELTNESESESEGGSSPLVR